MTDLQTTKNNLEGHTICPVEKAVTGTDDIEEAYLILQNQLNILTH